MNRAGALLSDVRCREKRPSQDRVKFIESGMMPDPEKIYVQVENAVERRRRHHIAEDNKEVITSLMSFDQWFTFKHPTHRDTTLYGVNVVLKSGSPEMEPETKRLITACGYNVRPSTNYFKKLQPPPDHDHHGSTCAVTRHRH